MSNRIIPILIACLAVQLRATAADTVDSFAADCAKKVSALLHQSAAIDPKTGVEDKETLKATHTRQEKLHAWFDAKGRNVSVKNCHTKDDLANLRDYPLVMANHAFLKLTLRERKKFIAKVDLYFRTFAKEFLPSLNQLVTDPKLKAFVQDRCKKKLTFKLRYFGSAQGKTIVAMYIPKTNTMLLNLDRMIKDPEQFYDSFEHELWHHLLPPNTEKLAENLWYEGLNEAMAEYWSKKLRKAGRRGRTVEYPIATAWGSILLDQAPEPTMAFMAGLVPRQKLAEELAKKGPLGKLLAQEMAASPNVSDAEKQQLEKILTGWSWKEDDKSPIDLTRYLKDGKLSNQALKKDFLSQKDFLNDLIRVKTIVHLQRLKQGLSAKEIGRAPHLPEHLRSNLKQVLRYAGEPQRHYRHWQE